MSYIINANVQDNFECNNIIINSSMSGTGCNGMIGPTGLNGDIGPTGLTGPTGPGYIYPGTTTASGASNTVTLNSKVGTVTFTGQTLAANSTLTLTVTNSLAGSNGLVSLYSNQNAGLLTGAVINSVTWNSSTNIVVVLSNISITIGLSNNFVISFISFN